MWVVVSRTTSPPTPHQLTVAQDSTGHIPIHCLFSCIPASKNCADSRKFRKGATHGSCQIHCKYCTLKLTVAFIETSVLSDYFVLIIHRRFISLSGLIVITCGALICIISCIWCSVLYRLWVYYQLIELEPQSSPEAFGEKNGCVENC